MLKNKNKLLLLFIFFIAFILRFFKIGDFPISLNRDELALGYNAYSVLKTGRGEHGEGPWPLTFISFGDYKMPGHIYLMTPFIKLFGLNDFSVRIASAITGTLAVLLVYLLVTQIFVQNKKIALFSSLFLALAPYHIHYSRVAYETQIAFFWQILGFWLLLRFKQTYVKLLGLLPLLLAMFTYNAPVFLILPFSLLFFYFYRQDFFSKKTRKSTFIFCLGLILIYGLYFFSFRETNQKKSEATIFTRKDYVEEVNKNIDYAHQMGIPIKVARLFFNKPIKIAFEFGKRYVDSFNPGYLFFGGDREPFSDLTPAGIPNIYPYLLPFLIIGFYFLFKNRQKKEYKLLFLWLLLSNLTSGFVNVSPNTYKLLDFHLIIIIIAAIGLWACLHQVKKYEQLFKYFLTAVLGFGFFHFLICYFIVFPKRSPRLWLPEFDTAVKSLKQKEFDHLFVSGECNLGLAYIYFAFYTPFEPEDFINQAQRSQLGFQRVERYDKYIFSNPPKIVGMEEDKYQDYKEKFGETLALSEYRCRQGGWEDIESFDFDGQPLWSLQKEPIWVWQTRL